MAKVLLGTSAGNGNSALQDWSGLLSLRLTVGPAAYIVLTVMVLQHPVLSNHAIALTGDVLLGLSVAGLANVLAFLGLALLYAWRRIVFHGLRHSSATYQLMISGGDIKSVQGTTGHASADLLVNTYAHIQQSSRMELGKKFENSFYAKPEASAQTPPVQGNTALSMAALLELLKDADPETKAQLRLALLT